MILYDEDRSEKVKQFLEAIEEVCKMFNLSISHEDGHGAFQIEIFNESNIEWLKCAGEVRDDK